MFDSRKIAALRHYNQAPQSWGCGRPRVPQKKFRLEPSRPVVSIAEIVSTSDSQERLEHIFELVVNLYNGNQEAMKIVRELGTLGQKLVKVVMDTIQSMIQEYPDLKDTKREVIRQLMPMLRSPTQSL